MNAYTGTFSNSYSTSLVWGISSSVGGLAGDNDGTISLCYSIGSVRGYSFVGGLVGYNNLARLKIVIGIRRHLDRYLEGGVGKTTEEMKQQLTYETGILHRFGPWKRDWLSIFTSIWTLENTDLSETRDINSLEELSKIGFYPDSPWWWNYELKEI